MTKEKPRPNLPPKSPSSDANRVVEKLQPDTDCSNEEEEGDSAPGTGFNTIDPRAGIEMLQAHNHHVYSSVPEFRSQPQHQPAASLLRPPEHIVHAYAYANQPDSIPPCHIDRSYYSPDDLALQQNLLQHQEPNTSARHNQQRRSHASHSAFGDHAGDDHATQVKRMRNRAAAQRCREKKRQTIETLQREVDRLTEKVCERDRLLQAYQERYGPLDGNDRQDEGNPPDEESPPDSPHQAYDDEHDDDDEM